MSDELVIRTLRAQAWQRAKGELEAMLATYYSGEGFNTPEQSIGMSKAVYEFVTLVEDSGLAE